MLVCRVESQSDSEFTKSISSTVGLVVLRVTVIKHYYCPTIPARWKLQKKNIYQWIPVLKPPFVLDDTVIKHKQPLSVDSAICAWCILTDCKYGGFCGYDMCFPLRSAVSSGPGFSHVQHRCCALDPRSETQAGGFQSGSTVLSSCLLCTILSKPGLFPSPPS